MSQPSKIHAPYNFVPLCGKVFFPSWANQISHDVPFKEGLSGTLKLELTAETPIFVRNGAAIGKDVEKESTFNHDTDGRYFIPGTSIKGAIRSVLEILSCGKMRLDEKAAYAQREWNNPTLYTIKAPDVQKTILCGYLKRVFMKKEDEKGKEVFDPTDTFEITNHGEPWRISQTKIGEYLGGGKLEENFSKHYGINLNKTVHKDGKEYDPKMTAYKYSLIDKSLKGLHFSKVSQGDPEYESYKPRAVEYDENGSIVGEIVLTGQPDMWLHPSRKGIKGAGKFYEFVFEDKTIGRPYGITKEQYDHYKFIYDKKETKQDWDRIKSLIDDANGNGAPVFFRLEGGKVKDFGFALLYRLPYEKTPFEALDGKQQETESSDYDLADCMFGRIGKDREEDKDKALRGRVQFSHAFADRSAKEDSAHSGRYVLSSPKASYYPIYVEQTGVSNPLVGSQTYKTYNDGTIRGWKRYVLKTDAKRPTLGLNDKAKEDSKTNDDQCSTIRPLGAGTTFTCDVNFFNLLPEELGALISAITFHGQKGCYHQFGGAKPFGFGRTTVTVSPDSYILELSDGGDLVEKKIGGEDKVRYMTLFQRMMKSNVGNGWLTGGRIGELLALASKVQKVDDKDFEYMTLEVNGSNNEFVKAKGGTYSLKTKDYEYTRVYLKKFSEIKGSVALQDFTEEELGKEDLANAELFIEEAQKLKEAGDLAKAFDKYNDAQTFCERKGLSALASNCKMEADAINKALEDAKQQKAKDEATQKLQVAKSLAAQGQYEQAAQALTEAKSLVPDIADECDKERDNIVGLILSKNNLALCDLAEKIDPGSKAKIDVTRDTIKRKQAEASMPVADLITTSSFGAFKTSIVKKVLPTLPGNTLSAKDKEDIKDKINSLTDKEKNKLDVEKVSKYLDNLPTRP